MYSTSRRSSSRHTPYTPALPEDEHQDALRHMSERARLEAEAHHSFKEKVYVIFEYPLSSRTAYWVNNLIFVCIIASTVTFVLETHPFFQVQPYPLWFGRCEIFFAVVFTAELALRFWSTKESTWAFISKPMNIIDFCAILPFWVDFFASHLAVKLDLRVLRVLRLARIFRLIRIGKYSAEIQVLMGALSKSWEAIALLFALLVAAIVFFGSLMVFLERGRWNKEMGCYVRGHESSCSPFESVPMSGYWAIATLTTVGYGDATPATPLGRVVACCTMIIGIFIIALPVAVLGDKFVDAYDHIGQEMGTKDMAEAQKGSEIADQLEKALADYERIRQACLAKVPQVQQLSPPSLVKMGRHQDEQKAHRHVDATFRLLEREMASSLADMQRLIDQCAKGRRPATAARPAIAVAPPPPV